MQELELNERQVVLLKNSIDLTLNSLTTQLNQANKEEGREEFTKVIKEYLELRDHIGGRPTDRK